MWRRIYPHAVLLIFANIILKASCKGSLTFLIDDTGSMYDDIRQVRSSVNRISDVVFNEKSSLIGNMVLVTFNDPDAQVRVVTENRNTFKRTLDAVYAHNIRNWDCWEPSMNGLLLALDKSNSDSYIYVFTDAPAKDYKDAHFVKEMCQKKQSQIVFVLTGRCHDYHAAEAFDVYFDIAQACSGLAFDVSKTDVEEVLRTIEETIKGNKTVITSTTVPAGVKKGIPFTIDDHTDYAIVSVSGRDVYLDIKGPSANIEKIMWNNNGKVVKLSNAKPGTYVATVMSQTKTSVVIVGRTDFFFTHGFSELKPKSLGDTSLQPIADSNVHLSISVTDDHHSVQILSAQILDMNEKPMKNPVPLTEISKDFYVTDPFVAPSQRFKIAVNGVVKATGKPIKRIVKIPITPAEPPKILPTNTKPIVEIAEGKAIEIEYNGTVKLTCKVVAFPEPKIEWINNNGGLVPSKMSLQEYPYKYISYMDISYASKGDRYKCYAVNNLGRHETIINVSVKEPFTVKSTPSGITKLTYGTEGTVTCDVTSRLPMDIHWYYANEMTGQTREIETSDKYVVSASRTQLKIKKMDLDLVGRYTCKVFLKNKKDVQKSFTTRVKIDGLIVPKVQGETDIKVTKGKTAIIECKIVSSLPAPKITWQFGGKSGSTFTPLAGSETVIRLANVEGKHEGKYKCVAENAAGKDEHVTTLFVQDLPKITTKSSIIHQATEGDALLRIPCVAVGIPKPVIVWKLSGHSITPSAKYAIEDGTLVIRDPKVSDTNSYTCEAKNEAGAVSATFKTYIRQAPKVSGVTAKKVRLGMPASIECTVEGEPKPTITWQFMDNSSSKFLPIPGSDKVLNFPRVENKHTGRYKCVAKNEIGSNEHITTLVVEFPPRIISKSSTVFEGFEGDISLKIPCDVVGIPQPVNTWKRNGNVIRPNEKYSIENGALIIRNLTEEDSTSYTCEAKNYIASVNAMFEARVKTAPRITGNTEKRSIRGSDVAINCKIIKGLPKPKITWQYMNQTVSKFTHIPGFGNVLRLSSVAEKSAGRYKCVAENVAGKDEHVTTLVIEFPPRMISQPSTVSEGLEGDMALRIPCDVVGIPKPVNTWKINGNPISPNEKYSIEDGALIIMNPVQKDSSSFTCEAKNYLGSVHETFIAKVEELINSLGIKRYVYILEDETRKLQCEGYSSASQSVRWFIEGVKVLSGKPYLEVKKATVSNDGNYTCRVNDKHGNTHTYTYVVDVGHPPQLAQQMDLSDWRGDAADILSNCGNTAKPQADVKWKFNNQALTNQNLTEVGVTLKWGNYKCNVTNVHGSVQRSFDVQSSACLINRKFENIQNMPLLLTDELTYPGWATTKHDLIVKQGDNFTLYCPNQNKEILNRFQKYPKQSGLKTCCHKQDEFLVGDKKYRLSDLLCTNNIQPAVVREKTKCLTETSQLIRVGYNVADFLENYEVCFDHAKNMPLYTRASLTETDGSVSTAHDWHTYPGIGNGKLKTGFTCKHSNSTCCYNKTQLVSPGDFKYGSAKKNTFFEFLNTVPYWRSCANSKKQTTWEDINEMVWSRLPIYTKIVAWSGTHTFQDKDGATVPRYLWKVLVFDKDESVAIIHVNDPTPTDEDIKCEDISSTYEDWFMSSDKFTYCCSVPSFVEAFGMRGIDFSA